MEKDNFGKKIDEVVDSSTEITEYQKALWHLFTFYAGSEENEAVYEAIVEQDGNLELLTKHLLERVKQLYGEE
jgi:phage-related minor tail protein